MGLDTSHDCWHGAYSGFNRWRKKLAEVSGYGDLGDYEGFGGGKKWPADDALAELLSHSDCDGILPAGRCAAMADRLESLLPALRVAGDGGGHVGSYEYTTVQFITGLRKAAMAGEDVDFH